jgi:hypothetical protein
MNRKTLTETTISQFKFLTYTPDKIREFLTKHEINMSVSNNYTVIPNMEDFMGKIFYANNISAIVELATMHDSQSVFFLIYRYCTLDVISMYPDANYDIYFNGQKYTMIDILFERGDDLEFFSWMIECNNFKINPKNYRKLALKKLYKCFRYIHKKLMETNSDIPLRCKNLWVNTKSDVVFSLFLEDNIICTDDIIPFIIGVENNILIIFIACQYTKGSFVLSPTQIDTIKSKWESNGISDRCQMFRFN